MREVTVQNRRISSIFVDNSIFSDTFIFQSLFESSKKISKVIWFYQRVSSIDLKNFRKISQARFLLEFLSKSRKFLSTHGNDFLLISWQKCDFELQWKMRCYAHFFFIPLCCLRNKFLLLVTLTLIGLNGVIIIGFQIR